MHVKIRKVTSKTARTKSSNFKLTEGKCGRIKRGQIKNNFGEMVFLKIQNMWKENA